MTISARSRRDLGAISAHLRNHSVFSGFGTPPDVASHSPASGAWCHSSSLASGASLNSSLELMKSLNSPRPPGSNVNGTSTCGDVDVDGGRSSHADTCGVARGEQWCARARRGCAEAVEVLWRTSRVSAIGEAPSIPSRPRIARSRRLEPSPLSAATPTERWRARPTLAPEPAEPPAERCVSATKTRPPRGSSSRYCGLCRHEQTKLRQPPHVVLVHAPRWTDDRTEGSAKRWHA